MRYISPRRIVLLAVLVLLIAPWASAAPRPGSTPPASTSVGIGIPDVLSLAWRFITGGWVKGCQLDPGGRCVTPSAPVSHPVGASGGHRGDRRPALPTKVGCQIDPSGHCLVMPVGYQQRQGEVVQHSLGGPFPGRGVVTHLDELAEWFRDAPPSAGNLSVRTHFAGLPPVAFRLAVAMTSDSAANATVPPIAWRNVAPTTRE